MNDRRRWSQIYHKLSQMLGQMLGTILSLLLLQNYDYHRILFSSMGLGAFAIITFVFFICPWFGPCYQLIRKVTPETPKKGDETVEKDEDSDDGDDKGKNVDPQAEGQPIVVHTSENAQFNSKSTIVFRRRDPKWV